MTNDTPKISWKIEQTNPDLIDKIREALEDVVDPEIGFNVVKLGMVREVMLNNNKLEITMILTTPFCPYGPSLMDTARFKIEAKVNIPTTVKMGLEPWDLSMMDEDTRAELGFY